MSTKASASESSPYKCLCRLNKPRTVYFCQYEEGIISNKFLLAHTQPVAVHVHVCVCVRVWTPADPFGLRWVFMVVVRTGSRLRQGTVKVLTKIEVQQCV